MADTCKYCDRRASRRLKRYGITSCLPCHKNRVAKAIAPGIQETPEANEEAP